MTHVVSITDFRNNIFDYANLVNKGDAVEVEKDGKRVLRVTAIDEDSPEERAKYLLEHVLPKVGGIWKDVPQSEFDKLNEQFRGKKAKAYMRKLRQAW